MDRGYNTIMRRIRTASAAIILAGAALLGTAGQAHAYSGTGWDGTDPTATGCDRSEAVITKYYAWITTGSGGYNLGRVDLRFSNVVTLGTVRLGCATAWARVVSNYTCGRGGNTWPYSGCGGASIVRSKGGSYLSYSCTIPQGGNSCWTKQLYDGTGYAAYATGYQGWGAPRQASASTASY